MNVIAGGSAQIANQVVVVRLENGQNLYAKSIGRLMAFIVQHKVAAFVLQEFRFGGLLALCFSEELLDRRIRAQRQGTLPRGDRVLGAVGCKLRIAEHGEGVGRVGRRADSTLGVG